MLEKIISIAKLQKLNVVKPFGCHKNDNAVKFTICAYTETISNSLAKEFEEVDQVEIVQGNILNTSCDALVSPANSFGDMSGGLDKAIDDLYNGNAQKMGIERIKQDFLGELPVGCALVLQMKSKCFPYLIIAPTMRIPGNVKGTINAYLAMRGLLVAIARHNETEHVKIATVAIPSLCTGVGGMEEKESAKQMRVAFDNVVMSGWESVKHPLMAPFVMQD